MIPSTAQGFRRLAVFTSCTIFLLIVVGGIVRVTESGLGCPDWPFCYGRPVPPFETTALIEMSHRYVAAFGGVMILLTAFTAWKNFRQYRWLLIPALVTAGMLAFQVPLGGAVVITELVPVLVSVHLAKALLIFGASIFLSVAATRLAKDYAPPPASAGYRWLVIGAAVGMFLVLVTGKMVVGNDASYACPDWPLCHGALVPAEGVSPLVWIHVIHRYAVAAGALLVATLIAVTLRVRKGIPGAVTPAWLLGGFFIWQAIVGALQVFTVMHPAWRGMHLAMASAVWAVLMVLTAQTLIGPVVAHVKKRVAEPTPAPAAK